MTPDVIEVKALPNFVIQATFADGEVRCLDMHPYLDYPAFAELREASLFMRAHVANGVVAWNEEIDLSPDILYLRGVCVTRAS